MPFCRRYFQPGAPGHATPVHLERQPGMRQQFVVNVPLFRSRSPRPMARWSPPLRLLPSQASTQSERAHAATRPHTHRKRSKAPLAIRTGGPTSLDGESYGDYLVATLSIQYLSASRAPGLGLGVLALESRCMVFLIQQDRHAKPREPLRTPLVARPDRRRAVAPTLNLLLQVARQAGQVAGLVPNHQARTGT